MGPCHTHSKLWQPCAVTFKAPSAGQKYQGQRESCGSWWSNVTLEGKEFADWEAAFNNYLSLNQHVIESSLFWRPLPISMENRGVVISVTCKLHNTRIDDFGPIKPHTLHRWTSSWFFNENVYQAGDSIALQYATTCYFTRLPFRFRKMWSQWRVDYAD